jgi:hypothetical protein
MFYTIKSIEPDIKNYTVKIIYSDDVEANLSGLQDLTGLVSRVKFIVIFNQVKMGHKGRSIIMYKK